MSLYNKYRPKKFDDIVGNEAVTKAIRSRLLENKLPSSLLLYGPSGCGKTTIARIIGLMLNCLNPDETKSPCTVCVNCKSILDGNNSDFMEINAADVRGIDSIRAIISKIMYEPSYLKTRVIILDEAQSLTNDAQNCLLKPLEEPPVNNCLIICTTEPDKLLKTVRNRCDKHEMSLLSSVDKKKLVQRVASLEGKPLNDEIVKAFTAECSPSPRDLLNQLDSLLAQDEPNSIETVFAVLSVVSEEGGDAKGIEFARGLIYKNTELKGLCRSLETGANLEGYRRLILSYAKKCLLGAKDTSSETRILKVMEAFIPPLEFSSIEADFISRVYKFAK